MCKNGGRPKIFWGGKKTKGNFSLKFSIFLTHILSPTLNYSLTKSSHCEKTGCKTSMAQLSQDLLSTQWEVKKTASLQPKKGEKIATLGSAFLKAEWKSPNKNRGVRRTPPTHGHPKRGWPSEKTLGCTEAQNFEGKRFSFFWSEKAEFSTRAAQDIPQKSEQNRFFRRFPLLEKRKKGEKKNWVSL